MSQELLLPNKDANNNHFKLVQALANPIYSMIGKHGGLPPDNMARMNTERRKRQ
jgi:hypothetical protein